MAYAVLTVVVLMLMRSSNTPLCCCVNAHQHHTSRVSRLITHHLFDLFLPQRTNSSCPAYDFYTLHEFLVVAAEFKGFGTTGSSNVAKRELAAFFANIAHETIRGCYIEEIVKGTYCSASAQWPCAKGKEYYGRGPIQLSWNYNYGAAGQALGFDGINHPEIVAQNAKISFETAVWYWMTQQSPTCHDAMVNNLGFGATIQAINGGLECGSGANLAEQRDRINLYTSFCSALDVQPGDNLSC